MTVARKEARPQMLLRLTVSVSFIHLKLGTDFYAFEMREDYIRVWATAQGLDYRTVNKILGFLEGGHAFEGGVWKEAFQRGVNLDAQKQWTGLT